MDIGATRRSQIYLPVLALFLGLWAVLPGTHLVMDEGYRQLQTHALRESFRFPAVISYPGMTLLGPLAEEVRPLPAHYSRFTGSGLVCFYSPAIALLSIPFTGKGVLLIQALSGFILWVYMWRRLEKNGFTSLTAALVPLLGTPLLFFSMRFWSYPLSILLALLSMEQAEKNRAVSAHMLVAAAALLRIEFSVAFLPVFLKLRSPWYLRTVSALPALLMLLGGNWILSGGEILGSHLSSSVSEQSLYEHSGDPLLVQKFQALEKALFSMVPGKTSQLYFLPGVFLWVLWGWNLGKKGGQSAPLVAAGLLSASVLAMWIVRGFPFLDGFSMKNPLIVFPALWMVTGGTVRSSRKELTVLALMLLLLLPMHTEGPDWGVRHLFLAFFLVLRHLKPSSVNMKAVFLNGGLAICTALLFLGVNRNRVENLNDMAARSGDALVTTNWIIPGWLTDSMQQGIPVIYTSNTGLFFQSLELLQREDPAVVCLGRDAVFTADLLTENGFDYRLSGKIDFGQGMSCVVFSRR